VQLDAHHRDIIHQEVLVNNAQLDRQPVLQQLYLLLVLQDITWERALYVLPAQLVLLHVVLPL